MSEINKRIEALEAELQKLKNEVKQEVKFKVGKWYKDINSLMVIYITEIKNGFKGYGLNARGEWSDKKDDDGLFYGGNLKQAERELIPATHQEVEELLIKEAKKRGFKDGVNFKTVERKCIANSYTTKFKYDGMNVCIYTNETVLLNNADGCIFCNGVWAEIIKDEPIMINGYEVEKIDNHFKIGCKQITRKELNHIKGFMERNNYVNVKFSSEDNAHLVYLETINKILAL